MVYLTVVLIFFENSKAKDRIAPKAKIDPDKVEIKEM